MFGWLARVSLVPKRAFRHGARRLGRGREREVAHPGRPNPSVPRRAGRRGAGRPTHRGGANTSFLALLAALSAMAAMFAVVTRIPPMTPGAVPFSAIPALSGGRRALSRPKIGPETFPDDPRARRGAVTYDTFNDAKSGAPAIELVWQRPRRPEGAKPKGIVFLAHGCHHAAVDFLPRLGPVRALRGLARGGAGRRPSADARGYVVAAVSSEKACWNTQGDARRVAAALERVRRRNPDLPRGAPVYAFGASSGGAFVAALPFFADVDGVVAQIAGVGFPRDPRSNTAFFATPAELGDALRESRGDAGGREGASPGGRRAGARGGGGASHGRRRKKRRRRARQRGAGVRLSPGGFLAHVPRRARGCARR